MFFGHCHRTRFRDSFCLASVFEMTVYLLTYLLTCIDEAEDELIARELVLCVQIAVKLILLSVSRTENMILLGFWFSVYFSKIKK